MKQALTRRTFLKSACIAAGGSLLTSGCMSHQRVSQKFPNILIILADDLGYGDVQCYNTKRGKIPTPNIDRFASEGMRFTDAHASSGLCSPSRYTLLTGRYHWRTHLQAGIVWLWGEPLIVQDRLTIATLAKQHGYQTAAIGKWHLGWDWPIPEEQKKDLFGGSGSKLTKETIAVEDTHRKAWTEAFSRPIKGGPTTRGFDYYLGTDVPNWPPYCFIENDRTVGIPSALLKPEQLKNHLAGLQGPAMENWSLNDILPTLQNKACDFISKAADSEKPFFLYLPLTSPHTPLAVNKPWQGKSGLNSPVADLVMETDAVIGKVLQTLEKSGQADNTLVILTSDNGFAPYVGVENLEKQGHFPSGSFRGYKGDAWEGGHRMPFIARWPGFVQPGTVCEHLIHHADIMATMADIFNAKLPDNSGEDSFSIMPLLRGENKPIRQYAISQSGKGYMAFRKGNWKLIAGPGGGGAWSRFAEEPKINAPAQLYDLSNDIAEQNNLYDQKPELAVEMLSIVEKVVNDGRSRPGVSQGNDVPVKWRQFMEAFSKNTP